MDNFNKNWKKSFLLFSLLAIFLFFITNVSADTYGAETFTLSGSWSTYPPPAACSDATTIESYFNGDNAYRSITIAYSGTYDLSIYYERGNNRCENVGLYIDGVKVGTDNQYAAGFGCSTNTVATSVSITAGAHTFKVQNDCSTSTANYAGLGQLIITLVDIYCDAGYYYSGGSCIAVGTGYYSPASDGNRYACPTHSTTTTTTASSLSQCLGAGGYYNCQTGTCSVAGAGYYSGANSNSRAQCNAGRYCSTTTNSAATGNGQCTGGYYCPAGSTSPTQNVCGYNKYCYAGVGSPTSCPAQSTTSVTTANSMLLCWCNDGYYDTYGANGYSGYLRSCTVAGANYYAPGISDFDEVRYACPANSDTNGVTTAGSVSQCLGNAGYYNCQTGTCSVAGAGYYSPTISNSRYACTAGYYCSTTTNSVGTGDGVCTAGYYCPSGSSSATQNVCGVDNYCPIGSGSPTSCPANSGSGGRTTQIVPTECNCDVDYYDNNGGSQSCTTVGNGYYSATDSDSRDGCSNKAANSDYSSSGAGTNNCPFVCIAGLTNTSRCTATGTDKIITFFGNSSYYVNLTVQTGSEIHFNSSSNITVDKVVMEDVGDQFFVWSGSELTINGSA